MDVDDDGQRRGPPVGVRRRLSPWRAMIAPRLTAALHALAGQVCPIGNKMLNHGDRRTANDQTKRQRVAFR